MGYGFCFLEMVQNNNNRRGEKWSERGRASGGRTLKEFLTVIGRPENRDFSQFLFHHPFYFKPDESADHRDVCHALMVGHHHIGVVAVI